MAATVSAFLAMVLVTEEIARAHSAMRVAINMQIGPALTLLQFGSEEQKKNSFRRSSPVKKSAASRSPSPTPVPTWRRYARPRRKDGDRYLLNGSKLWISNAPVTTWWLGLRLHRPIAKTPRHERFYADWDRPGLTRKPLETMGAHCSPIGELIFDNFPIPVANRLGNEGDGFKICMWQLNQTRLNCAAGALGVARAAKEAAVSYCNQRFNLARRSASFR